MPQYDLHPFHKQGVLAEGVVRDRGSLVMAAHDVFRRHAHVGVFDVGDLN